MADFESLGLTPALLKTVEKQGFTEPTPIQLKTIPQLLLGRDVMGLAQTGGGKTAAFSLPLLQKLSEGNFKARPHHPRALILAPTRELAKQIHDAINLFSYGLKLKNGLMCGGVPYNTQIRRLKAGVDILVSTPGRLMDHMQRETVRLTEVETFILDEADRMLDMGFIEDVQYIADHILAQPQTVMFSATMSAKVRGLSKKILHEPEFIEIERDTTVADTINHYVHYVASKHKNSLLLDILNGEDVGQALVFTKTKSSADDVADMLKENGVNAASIHGDKHQRMRDRILGRFRKGTCDVLVATDVAARGIDVPGVSHVVNYDLPMEAENYVHRVGRTGRAGLRGKAISFCNAFDRDLLKNIEQLLGQPIDLDDDHPYHIELKFNKGSSGTPSRRKAKRGRPTDRSANFKSNRGDDRRGKPKRAGGKRSDAKRSDAKRSDDWKKDKKPFRKSEGRKSEGRKFEGAAKKSRYNPAKYEDDQSSDRKNWRNDEKPARRKSAAKPHRKGNSQDGERRAEKPANTDGQRPTLKLSQKPSAKKPGGKATRKPTGKKFGKKHAGNASGKPGGKSFNKSAGKPSGKPARKSSGKPGAKSGGGKSYIKRRNAG